MSLLTTSKVRARAQQVTGHTFDSASILTKKINEQASLNKIDIFLSHAFDDKQIILGVALTLEDLGFSVYLDWRDDKSLDRKNVSKETASILRDRMKSSKCLFFATTDNASSSKWMPWELGFMDGYNSRAAILPVKDSFSDAYVGQEYLGIYPYIVEQKDVNDNERLWVHRNSSIYVIFNDWLTGKEPFKRN